MYDAQIGRWHCVDPLAERYNSQSTYHFSGNNPIRFVDLNGMNYDEYGVDSDGDVYLLKEKEGPDELYAVEKNSEGKLEKKDVNEDGKMTKGKDYVSVNDDKLLPQLKNKTNPASNGELKGHVTNTNDRNDALNVFTFVADNSNVEWSYQRYTDGTLSIATAGKNAITISGFDLPSNASKAVAADVHSHPNATYDDYTNGGDYGHKKRVLKTNPNAKIQCYRSKFTKDSYNKAMKGKHYQASDGNYYPYSQMKNEPSSKFVNY